MKYLGKITRAEFGTIHDMPFLMGLQLDFSFSSKGVSTGSAHCINTCSSCKWDNAEQRQKSIEREWDYIYKLLKEAKVKYVSELVGKPVEIELDGNVFKGFRILTEVI